MTTPQTTPSTTDHGTTHFILGFLPNTRSRIDPSRPQVWIEFTTLFAGTTYHFERFERGARGAFEARLRIYDAADYPEGLIASLVSSKHIVPYVIPSRRLVTPDKLGL